VVVRLLETAKEDLREAWKFHEESAAGLGDYFLDSVQADVRSLKIFGGIHEMSEGSSCRYCRPCVGRAMTFRYLDLLEKSGGRVPRVSNRWNIPRPQHAPAHLGLWGLGAPRRMQRRRLDPD
jgi:hypothetical protein